MLLGLTEPTAGTAKVDGIDPTRAPLAVKSRVGYLPDDVGFYDDLTARQNLRYTAELNRIPKQAIDDRIDMEHYSDDSHINVGTGVDLSIKELAETIRDVVNPEAELVWDTSKPDGTPRKLLDVSRLRELGWSPTIDLRDGLTATYQWFCDQVAHEGELRGVEPQFA